MTATIIEIVLTALVLFGIIKEKKLIEFEDKMLDKLAKAIADRINRRNAAELAQQRRSKMHIVKSSRKPSGSNRFIA